MPDSEPATPFIPPRPDLGTPLGNSPAVLPSVIPMSPSHSQVCRAPQNWAYTCSPPYNTDNTAPSLRRYLLPLRTRSTPLTPAHHSSRPPWRPQDLITCPTFNCRRMYHLRLCLHRLIRLGHNITILACPQTGSVHRLDNSQDMRPLSMRRRAWYPLHGQLPCPHLTGRTGRMRQDYHQRTPRKVISALPQVPLQHKGFRFRILPQRHSLPCRTGIQWPQWPPIKRQHGLLLPWLSAHRQDPHRPLHRRASLNGSRAPSATTKSDILLQGLIVCERIYSRDENL